MLPAQKLRKLNKSSSEIKQVVVAIIIIIIIENDMLKIIFGLTK
jgi:hypothetical protein